MRHTPLLAALLLLSGTAATPSGAGRILGNPQTDEPALPSCHASGNGGQKIFVFPTADLVVVFTGSSYNKARYSHQQPVLLLNRFILPALTS